MKASRQNHLKANTIEDEEAYGGDGCSFKGHSGHTPHATRRHSAWPSEGVQDLLKPVRDGIRASPRSNKPASARGHFDFPGRQHQQSRLNRGQW